MTRKKTRKFQSGTAPVQNIAPAKASTAGKAEGVETISGGSNRWTSPVITTAKIREIEDSALLQEPIQNLVNLIFRGPAQVTVYDPAGETDDVLSEEAARRYEALDLYTAHQQAFYDGLLGGCGVFSPGYDEMEKKDVFRHMPWYSFSKRPTMFSDTYNEIMPGITVDKSTRKVRVFQVQDDAMLEPIEIQNFAIIRDPTGPSPAGKPMCLPVVPIVWNYNYAIKVIQQKLNRVGAPPVFPLANVTTKNKELWESFAKTWGKDTVFVLPEGTEFADLKIVDNRVAEEYAAWLKKQATDYWNPATFIQKDGNSIGGSDSGALELVHNFIDRTLSWVENGITKATQNFLLNGDWTDDGGYLQRGYRVEIKHTRPSVSKDAAVLAEVAELAKNGAITVNEMRQSLPNTDLGELTPEEEQALQDKIAARQPQNPFTLGGGTTPGSYEMIGNVQTLAQRTEVMSDTERALIEATRKCAADVKRIALKDYPHQPKPGFFDRVKNLFAPVNNASDEGTWVTINGAHILIKEGESRAEAFKRTTGDDLKGSGSSSGSKSGSKSSGAGKSSGKSESKSPKTYKESGLSKEQTSAVERYTSKATDDYEKINSYIREGKVGSGKDKNLEKTIADLDSAFTEPLPKGTTIYNGKKAEIYSGLGTTQGTALIKAPIGSTFKDADYQSFTTDKETANMFAKNLYGGGSAVVLKMEGDGKTKHINIGGDEHEVLLPRGKTFKIKGKSMETYGGRTLYTVDVELVDKVEK